LTGNALKFLVQLFNYNKNIKGIIRYINVFFKRSSINKNSYKNLIPKIAKPLATIKTKQGNDYLNLRSINKICDHCRIVKIIIKTIFFNLK